MITKELYPGVVMATIEQHEVDIIEDSTQDLLSILSTMEETNFFDIMAERGVGIREKLPCITEFLGSLSSHNDAKVAVMDYPQHTVEGVRPTPLSYLRSNENNLFHSDVYRGIILGIADWYGYGYTTQQESVIHNNIIQVEHLAPVAGHSASAKHELGLHVEDASYNLGEERDISPDFLTLHYYRNPHLVPTIVSMPDWNELSAQTRDLLSEEWFYNRTNPAQGGEAKNPSSPVSIIYGPHNDPWMRLNTAKMDIEDYSPSRQRALGEMRHHLEARRIELGLRAGQIAIIDNRRVLHGRPAFRRGMEPSYDGTDRWQRRVTVSLDADRIKRHEKSYRIVDPTSVLST